MATENNGQQTGLNRAKPYQLMLFPLNNGATNVYFVLVLSYIATFGSNVLALGVIFASLMVTGMRLFDAVTDPIIGALMDRTSTRFGKFRPFMLIGNGIMALSVMALYTLTPLIPASAQALRYVAFVLLYAVWVIGIPSRPPARERARRSSQMTPTSGRFSPFSTRSDLLRVWAPCSSLHRSFVQM